MSEKTSVAGPSADDLQQQLDVLSRRLSMQQLYNRSSMLKALAKKHNLPFKMTSKQVVALYEGGCSLTGMPFYKLGQDRGRAGARYNSMGIMLLDWDKGFVSGNLVAIWSCFKGVFHLLNKGNEKALKQIKDGLNGFTGFTPMTWDEPSSTGNSASKHTSPGADPGF